MIQTYSPEHYSIQTAARQDYQAFYTEEMNYRELMGYPPAEHLMAVLVACEDEALLEKGMHKMEQYIELNRGFAKMRIQFDFDPMSGF